MSGPEFSKSAGHQSCEVVSTSAMSRFTAARSRALNASPYLNCSPSGLATAGFLARIFRLSRFGHQSRLASPIVGCVRPRCATGHPPASGVAASAASGSWFSDTGILPGLADELLLAIRNFCGSAAGADAPVNDLGFVDREAAVVGSGQARRLADRAVDVCDDAARPAHDVVVVVPDTALEPGRAVGRFDAADESRCGERVQGVVNGLQGDMTYAVPDPGGDRLDAEMVAFPDGVEQSEAGCRHPQAGTTQLSCDSRDQGCGHEINPI